MSWTMCARGDSPNANNSELNARNTSQTPTATLRFEPGEGADINVLLEYNGCSADTDTVLYVNCQQTTFAVEFSRTPEPFQSRHA